MDYGGPCVYRCLVYVGLLFGFIDAQNNRIPQKWTDGIVPYKISERFAPAELKLILESLAVISDKTCVKFKPFKGETSFIQISVGMQCQSAIGRTGGAQSLLLARDCLNPRSILRELMHVLGFNDEHLRSDRDQFITVNLNNVNEGDRIFFEKLTDQELPRFGLPYDYDSVLQVPANWKRDPKASPDAATLIPKPGKGVSQLGRSQTLTHLDIGLALHRAGYVIHALPVQFWRKKFDVTNADSYKNRSSRNYMQRKWTSML